MITARELFSLNVVTVTEGVATVESFGDVFKVPTEALDDPFEDPPNWRVNLMPAFEQWQLFREIGHEARDA